MKKGTKVALSILGVILLILLVHFIYFFVYPEIEPSLYPRDAGIDSRTGLPLEKIYHCQDICPMQRDILTVYKGISTVEECNKIGGNPSLSGIPSSGRFIGCKP